MSSQCLTNLANAGVNVSTCLVNGECKEENATYAVCACTSGLTGLDCDIKQVPFTWVLVFDGIFYFLVFFLWIFLAIRRYKQTAGKDYDLELLKGLETSHAWISQSFLLLYRFVVFCFVFGVHIYTMTGGGVPSEYKFYTIWNFITLITYFALGLGMSLMVQFKGKESIVNSAYWRFNAKLHYILLEIELPTALIVDIVVWAILLPSCGTPCPSLIQFSSFVEHLTNFFLMSGDFLLSRHAFDVRHWFFILALPTCYAIFHLFWTIDGQLPVYFFLDAASNFEPAWVVGVLLIHIAIFFFIWSISQCVLGRVPEDLDTEPSYPSKSLVPDDVSAPAADAENPKFQHA
jgi:hypothetical protein